jgi:hypothetical protein
MRAGQRWRVRGGVGWGGVGWDEPAFGQAWPLLDDPARRSLAPWGSSTATTTSLLVITAWAL